MKKWKAKPAHRPARSTAPVRGPKYVIFPSYQGILIMLRTQSGIQVEKWESKCPQKSKPDYHSACANKGSILTSHCSGNELTLVPMSGTNKRLDSRERRKSSLAWLSMIRVSRNRLCSPIVYSQLSFDGHLNKTDRLRICLRLSLLLSLDYL